VQVVGEAGVALGGEDAGRAARQHGDLALEPGGEERVEEAVGLVAGQVGGRQVGDRGDLPLLVVGDPHGVR
jgi:hypothetical protein